MTYNLEFKASALREWQKLDSSIREQFKKKLKERLETPRVESCKLAGMPDCYKIKLRMVLISSTALGFLSLVIVLPIPAHRAANSSGKGRTPLMYDPGPRSRVLPSDLPYSSVHSPPLILHQLRGRSTRALGWRQRPRLGASQI